MPVLRLETKNYATRTRSKYQTMLTLWAAMLMSVFLYFLVTPLRRARD